MSDEVPQEVPPTEAAPVEAAPAEHAPTHAEEPAAATDAPAGSPGPVALKSSGSRGSVALGGGGFSCSICSKVSFPAETVMFETKPYHSECFRCSKCNKKMDGGAQAAGYENVLYCRQCFEREGLHLKQRQVKWTPKTTAAKTGASRFGGGGTQCTVCGKTAYAGETVQFEMKPYHNSCFKCTECTKDLKPAETGQYEAKLYCTRCFEKNNFHRKQAEVKWTPKTGHAAGGASRFGGGGQPCTACNTTVYAGEAVSYDMKVYHAKCLKCSECTKECKQSEVAKYEEKLYCQRCFEKNGLHLKQAQVKFQPKAASTGGAAARFSNLGGGGTKCVVCAKTVYPAETVQYESRAYHSKCFACTNCQKELTPSGAEHNEGKVYCKKCFMEAGLHMARVKPTAAGTAEAASS